ncbi:hypothetical protein BLX24_25980 [Arsenicibacter rosenii]|uniref:Uncharacterized protein n=2 Tax=Arsenicibacter rosenii TaxID=1750698 RepID=A0A1S2VEB2_9BACT|nr:hypothetical protein BLX24_25980 [Arsenicibacter rosenii]
MAQRSSVSKNIIVDDLIMTIKVDIEEPGRTLHYHKRFNIEGMDSVERQALETRILDSLGVNGPAKAKRFQDNQPVASAHGAVISSRSRGYGATNSEVRSVTTGRRPTGEPIEEVVVTGYAKKPDSWSKEPVDNETIEKLTTNDNMPYSKQIKDDPETGRLFMRYRYEKDGEEFIFERTVNAQGKSDKEKSRIIRETEKSLGLK